MLRRLLSLVASLSLLCAVPAACAVAPVASPLPLGFNLTAPAFYNPCPFIEQALCGQRGRGSAATLTLMVPFSSKQHSYTLRTDPAVKSLKVAGVAVTLTKGVATFDASGTPGKGTTVALATPGDPPVSIMRTDWLDLAKRGESFSPDFLGAMAGSSGFRFMDWAHTNASTATAWTPPTAPTFNGIAVPVEVMAALCAKTHTNMWLNIPPSISTAEAVRVIRIARAILPASLKLHVEWSNEVWNRAFAVGKIAAASPGGSAAYYGAQSAELYRAIKSIAGVDLILAWQYTSSIQGKQKVIDAFKAAGGDLSHVGGFAIAPYAWNSGASVKTYFEKQDQAGLIADLTANQRQYSVKIADTVKWAAGLGLKVMYYETGLQPNPRGKEQQAFAVAANRTPAAAAIFRQILADADAAGVSERYAFISAAQAQFGFYPDYDADPYPIGKVWQDYNRKVLPMRAAPATR